MSKPDKRFSIRYNVTALGGKKGEVKIYSVIDTMKFFPEDPAVTADDFDKSLKALGDVDELTVRINSPGGVLSEAVAIRTTLMKHPAKKTIDIEGDCASAATIIACLPNAHVRMAKGSQYMIHQAKFGARGTAENMLSAYHTLVKSDQDMAEIYAERTGKTTEECMALMKAETWFTAEEAVGNHFADEVLTGEDAEEPIVACAVSPETWAMMQACYDHAPTHFIAPHPSAAPTPSPQGEGQIISPDAKAVAADVSSEHTQSEGGNTMPDLKTATAEQLNQENPALAQEIARQAVEAERERVQQIEAMTPPYAEYEQLQNEAVKNGTSIGDYIKQVVAMQQKKKTDYLENRKQETAPAAEVKSGSSKDNDPAVSAKAQEDKFADDVAKLAAQETNVVSGMAQ